jgi:hypothetical protein
MGKIHWIPVEGEIRVEESDKVPTLDAMQKFVGGYVESVHVHHNGKSAEMYVNEEGALPIWLDGLPLKMNRRATQICHQNNAVNGTPVTYAIHGPAILLEDIRGD